MASTDGTAALYDLHGQRLFAYLCRAVGQADAAKDLVQEVFLRVTRSEIPDGPDHAIRAWLFRIAHNLVIDRARSTQRAPGSTALDDAPLPTRPASQDVSAAVNEALNALDPIDRHVFLLREVAGLGWDDIAAASDLSRDAVRSRLHRTRLELRDRLAAPITHRISSPIRRSPLESE